MAFANIVVIGTSAGGMEALTKLVEQLPTPFAAPILVVQHQAPENNGEALRSALSRSGRWVCVEARSGAPIETGHIYVAPPDHHLMVLKAKLLVTKGARENRSRPAIERRAAR